MAWIESHQSLARHIKTKRLARRLGVSIPTTIGHLHLLWWWSMDNIPDGNLSLLEPEDIADEMMWDGEPVNLINALIESGFVDQLENGLILHDWHDYVGKLVEKRRQDTERKRKNRSKSKGQSKEIQRISDGHSTGQDMENPQDGAGNSTVPNSTVPNLIIEREYNEDRLRILANTCRLKGCGIDGLETIYSYIGQADIEVIEKAIKKTEGKHVNYFVEVINGWISEGKTTLETLNPRPEGGQTNEEYEGHSQDAGSGRDSPESGSKQGGSYYDQYPGLIQKL